MGSNPLVNESFKVRIRKARSGMIQEDDVWVDNLYEQEVDRLTKVFHTPDNRRLIAGLRPSAKSLFLWLIFELEVGRDYIWIPKHRYMSETFTSAINTYKSGIKELSRYYIVYPHPTVKDVYWINPEVFFSGSRAKLYRNNIEEIN